jgi:hypothetical protein
VEIYGRTKQATDDSITQRIRFARRVTNAIDRYSECVILVAFPRQKWFRESTSTLRLFLHCLCYVLTVSSVLLIMGQGPCCTQVDLNTEKDGHVCLCRCVY